MESLRAPRWERPADTWSPSRAEPTHQRTPTPIFNALIKEWCAAGRTVPATTATIPSARRRRAT